MWLRSPGQGTQMVLWIKVLVAVAVAVVAIAVAAASPSLINGTYIKVEG